MRLSCNGCRVLRKGCAENCTIRPCLDWITSPESQANATLFLAKFYGRAGLLNLINAGPPHLRPSIFKSLLHEACGRIVNPVHGSAGLYSTGSWQLCQAAVDAVLSGSPIAPMDVDEDSGADHVGSLLKACDIRHVAKEERGAQSEKRTKRRRTRVRRRVDVKMEVEPATESSGGDSVGCGESRTSRSGGSEMGSVDTVEDTVAKPNGLMDVSLGLSLFPIIEARKEEDAKEEEIDGCDRNTWACDLSLGLPLSVEVNKNIL